MKILKHIFLIPVYIYQKVISPIIPSRCIYKPTCSQYFVQSVMKHGIIKGSIMGIFRIFRCHSMFKSADDPVPDEFSKKALFEPYKKFRDKDPSNKEH